VRLEASVPEPFLDSIRAPFAAAGGAAIDTPLAEPLGVYLDLAGEALRERLFLVQSQEREDRCLRPDFTVGIAKAHIASGATSGRYVYEGPAFRVAPAGSARSEQFRQIGLEAFGTEDPAAADAEAAVLAWDAASAGGREDLSLILGDVGLFAAFLAAIGVAGPAAARLTASLSRPARLERELASEAGSKTSPLAELLVGLEEMRAAAVLEEIWSLAGIERVGGRSAADVVHRLTNQAAAYASASPLSGRTRDLIRQYLAIDGEPSASLDDINRLASGKALDLAMADWDRRLAAMSTIPAARMRFAAGLHRPFGYYDGVLFEVRSAALGDDLPVAAGGRYDGLLSRLGHPAAVGAVGCMVRPGRAWKDGAS
jgi:ATP phosphoribosyltransferase regulatory subunit